MEWGGDLPRTQDLWDNIKQTNVLIQIVQKEKREIADGYKLTKNWEEQ